MLISIYHVFCFFVTKKLQIKAPCKIDNVIVFLEKIYILTKKYVFSKYQKCCKVCQNGKSTSQKPCKVCQNEKMTSQKCCKVCKNAKSIVTTLEPYGFRCPKMQYVCNVFLTIALTLDSQRCVFRPNWQASGSFDRPKPFLTEKHN